VSHACVLAPPLAVLHLSPGDRAGDAALLLLLLPQQTPPPLQARVAGALAKGGRAACEHVGMVTVMTLSVRMIGACEHVWTVAPLSI